MALPLAPSLPTVMCQSLAGAKPHLRAVTALNFPFLPRRCADMKKRMIEAMGAAAEEEMGAVMVFAMVSAAKEWLTENFDADVSTRLCCMWG